MPKPDAAHRETDKELAALERRIAKLYRKAGKKLQETIDAYFEQFKQRDEEMQALIGTVLKELAADMGMTFDDLKNVVASLHEFNPMMGHRGCSGICP